MGRRILRVLGFVAILVVFGVAWAYWYAGQIGVEPVADRLYMMTGIGGNVGVLVTDEGVVVVDTMTLVRQGEAIRERIAELTDEPVIAVINTHYHLDHTHGNPAFRPGTKVLSTDRTLTHLRERDAGFWKNSPAKDLLPNDTFADERVLTFGDDTLRLVHPGRGHTDGDLVVLFERQRVLHTGDLFFNGRYPNIDLEAGGTVEGWIETLDRVKKLEYETVIPGHGPVTDRAGLSGFQDFLVSLWTQTNDVLRDGGTLEDARERVDLSEFNMGVIPFAPYLNHGFVVGRAWEEASAKAGR